MVPLCKFVYGSNRGHVSIVGYEIDQDIGKLDYVSHWITNIKNLRSFTIDLLSKSMSVTHYDANNIITLSIVPEAGKLEDNQNATTATTPCCS